MIRNKVTCENCDTLISLSNYSKHIISTQCKINKEKKLTVNIFLAEDLICVFCNKECKNTNSYKNHVSRCRDNTNRNYKNGMTGKKGSNQFKKAKQSGQLISSSWNKGLPGTFTGKTHTVEARRKISQKLSTNNKGGRCKWYEVAGQKVQGTWERDIATKFEQLGIRWLKLKTNKDTLKYEMSGKIRSYTPDFYLLDYDIFVEVKGFWWGDDKEK